MEKHEGYKLRKGMCLISKEFSRSVEGEWKEAQHKINSIYDRKYAKHRVEDLLKVLYGDSYIGPYWVYDIDEDKYLVVIISKKNSKKYDCLRKLGFVETEIGVA